MKKTRIMVFALMVAVMLMGAGYAAWTDILTINNTVSTGNLDVDFSDGTIGWNSNNANVAYGTAAGSENTATITLNNLYPGAVATVTIPVTNNGTIPVKDGTFTFDSNKPAWLAGEIVSVPTLNANGGTGNVVITFTVGEDAPQAPQGQNVQFTATATYNQFNK